MILTKLYSSPDELFPSVEFDLGFNFIYGYKEFPDDFLHGIGKSLYLDFLDFALLSDFKFSGSTRLNRAFNKCSLRGKMITLEFKVGNGKYKISRSFDSPGSAYFTQGATTETFKLNDLKKILFNLIFNRSGDFHSADTWYRDLIKFYLKIQKFSDEKFTDPIRYTDRNESVLNQYHLFLLGISNLFAYKNFRINSELNNLKRTRNASKDILLSSHSIKNIRDAKQKLINLNSRIEKLRKTISELNMSDYFGIQQKQADELSSKIKSLRFLISSESEKLEEYETSAKTQRSVSLDMVDEIYRQTSALLADNVSVSLQEAKDFRTWLHNSRSDFLRTAIPNLRFRIKQRTLALKELESRLDSIHKTLSDRKAADDIKNAYNTLSALEKDRSELQSRLDIYKSVSNKIQSLISQDMNLFSEADHFINDSRQKIDAFKEIMGEVYSNIFGNLEADFYFDLVKLDKTVQKIRLDVLPNQKYSHGKNQGRTLVYDLAVLFNSIDQKLNAPRFLVHDGIFDSLDRSHLFSLYKYCNDQLKKGYKFQYIVSLNQLNENEGDADLNHEKLMNISKIKVSKDQPLLGKLF